MFSFLLPKEHGFFNFFDQHAAVCVETTRIFLEMVEHYGDAPAKAQRIEDEEHKADEITHHTMEMLHKTFITPIDRDQIHSLITTMDDIVDLTQGAARRMLLYEIAQPTQNLIEMAKILSQSALEVQKAVGALHNLKNAPAIMKSCIEINKLENDGDALRDSAVARLFTDEKDAVSLFKWKEIYESVETALDCCEDVANIIEGVVLENA